MYLYDRLYTAFLKCYSDSLSKGKIQSKVNEFWVPLKTEFKKDPKELERKVQAKIEELCQQGTKKNAHFLNFFVKLPSKGPSTPQDDPKLISDTDEVCDLTAVVCTPISSRDNRNNESSIQSSDLITSSAQKALPTPKQDALKSEISILESEINTMVRKREAGLGERGIGSKIKKLRRETDKKKKELKSKINHAQHMKKFRAKQKSEILSLKSANPHFPSSSIRTEPGRPSFDEKQSGLLLAICDIATYGSSAADRRRSEILRTCKTLDELHTCLLENGFTISRTSTYRRLIPKFSGSLEGKRHVKTVPVKLCRAQTDRHREHSDQYFCKATVYSLEELASILGPEQVLFISQDDKAKVPIGKTAAKVQAPVLMHMNYRVRLDDHDFAVGARHQLTPSVYAGIVIKENCMGRKEAVTYSGPTYIAIRSGKHSSSTASTHANDLIKLLKLYDFKNLAIGEDEKVKPVVILSVDGGPDENPRYKKVISHCISHFKEFDLDGLFVFTNAPGRSAYNRVERRMAPLSRELATVVLPYEHYGSHLDSQGKTIDNDLELKNFQHAGEALAEIWSKMVIDGHNVIAEYIPPGEELPETEKASDAWYAKHVRESQYFLQIVKCADNTCCPPCRSSLKNILNQGFFPAPFPMSQKPFKIPMPDEVQMESFPSFLVRQSVGLRPNATQSTELAYDLYCPSIKNDISNRTCSVCGLYFASKISMNNHRKNLHGRYLHNVSRVRPLRIISQRPQEVLCVMEESVEWIDIEDANQENIPVAENVETDASVICNISEWISASKIFIDEEE